MIKHVYCIVTCWSARHAFKPKHWKMQGLLSCKFLLETTSPPGWLACIWCALSVVLFVRKFPKTDASIFFHRQPIVCSYSMYMWISDSTPFTINTVVSILGPWNKGENSFFTEFGLLTLIYINLVLFVCFYFAFLMLLFHIYLWQMCFSLSPPHCCNSVSAYSYGHCDCSHLHTCGKLENSFSHGVPSAAHTNGHPAEEAASL